MSCGGTDVSNDTKVHEDSKSRCVTNDKKNDNLSWQSSESQSWPVYDSLYVPNQYGVVVWLARLFPPAQLYVTMLRNRISLTGAFQIHYEAGWLPVQYTGQNFVRRFAVLKIKNVLNISKTTVGEWKKDTNYLKNLIIEAWERHNRIRKMSRRFFISSP